MEPLKFENGKPTLLSGEVAPPNVLSSKLLFDNLMSQNDTRLRIFSGTANHALSQVCEGSSSSMNFYLRVF